MKDFTKTDSLIASFMPDMELFIPPNPKYAPYWKQYKDGYIYKDYPMRPLPYHSSWDSLMPVVEYIETLHNIDKEGDWGPYYISIHQKFVTVNFGRFRIGDPYEAETKFESVYNAVVGFVEYYNKNK